jgi:hypothetical protein
VIAYAIKLGLPGQFVKRSLVILMGFDVGKMNQEGQIATINQDVFQDIRMFTAGWDAIGG